MSRGKLHWLVLLAGLLHAAPSLAATITVVQRNRSFSVASVSIAAGDTLHFTNEDEFDHQMYVDSRGFTYESDEQEPGTGIDITFPTPGSFTVQCHIHPRMALHVDVH